MQVWLLKIGEGLPLTAGARLGRMGSIAEALLNKGHQITWWASAFDHQKRIMLFEKDQSVKLGADYELKILYGRPYRKNISLSRYYDHQIIAKKFKKFSKNNPKPDLIVAAMPTYDLAFEAVLYAKANRVPIVIDVRDQWPDIFVDNVPRSMKKIVHLILSKDRNKLKNLLQQADGITSIMPHILDWALHYAGRSVGNKDRVFYLGAEKGGHINFSHVNPILRKKIDNIKEKFIFTFIGTFNEYYHPGIIVDVAKQLKNRFHLKNIHFILAGDGPYYQEVCQSVVDLSNVTMTGWLNKDEINYVLSVSKVGICHCTKEVVAFPNKAYVYMSAGLPVITSVQGEFAAIVRENNIGKTFPVADQESLCQVIEYLYQNQEERQQMAVATEKLFSEKYDKNTIYQNYVKFLESMF